MTKPVNTATVDANEQVLTDAINHDLTLNKEYHEKAKKQTAAILGELDKAIKAAQLGAGEDVDSSNAPNIFEIKGAFRVF